MSSNNDPTFWRTVSRIFLMSSMSIKLGSCSCQSTTFSSRIDGHCPESMAQPMVITSSDLATMSSVSLLSVDSEMSIPISDRTCATLGLTPSAGSVPADSE